MEDQNLNSSESDSSEENQLVSLNFEESRVLGSLIEKELTTPEYYPLTLNSWFLPVIKRITVCPNLIWMKARYPKRLKN
jgi:hypothetical protein